MELPETWLRHKFDWARERIDAGDPDFNNIVYRTHRSAETLLTLWFPNEDITREEQSDA